MIEKGSVEFAITLIEHGAVVNLTDSSDMLVYFPNSVLLQWICFQR